MKSFLLFLGCLVLAFLPALSGFVTRPDDWYFALVKPPLNPPPWIFAPVWTLLYALMGISHFLYTTSIAPAPRLHHKARGHAFYVIQLVLNAAWSLIFFAGRNPVVAGIDILLLLALIVATVTAFARFSAAAACLLVPYLLWVSFATYLNLGIAWLNR